MSDTYRKRVEELFSRFHSVQRSGFTDSAFHSGLEGMQSIDALLGSPWKAYPCIHVAGTNGKGSVCSMIAASLASEGKKVGLYTSPHILDFRERMKIVSADGFEEISEAEVIEFLDRYLPELGSLSFFEVTTGMAMWWMRERKVDAAVFEVGLGGRLDSTNIITPVVSVVTSISLDHCGILGDTRAQIASEKAGIFKRGVPAVVGFKDIETSGVFEKFAAGVGAELHFVEGKFDDVQENNAATASLALRLLGHTPNERAFRNMASLTGLRCRWEKIVERPETIADIGHNPAALKKNFERLVETGRPLIIVYGIMADKDLDSIIPLMPGDANWFLCAPHTPRALAAEVLYRRISTLRPGLNLRLCASVAGAVKDALQLASEVDNSLVYIGGSTFVTSEALFYLQESK